jgi:hypothetical protein
VTFGLEWGRGAGGMSESAFGVGVVTLTLQSPLGYGSEKDQNNKSNQNNKSKANQKWLEVIKSSVGALIKLDGFLSTFVSCVVSKGASLHHQLHQ